MSYIVVWKVKVERAHTHIHTRAPAKLTFLDVLDYSEYSDTNIMKKNFYTKTVSSVKNQKACKSGIFYCFLTDIKNVFL